MDIEEIVYEDVDFSRLNQNRAQRLALVCTLVSLYIPQKEGFFWPSE
jgi:hypothetical protein